MSIYDYPYARSSDVRSDVIELMKPPIREKLSESARRLLYVEESGSMVPWDGDLVPYMHEPMNCLQSRKYDAVIFAGPARTAKTVSLVDGWLMHTIVNDPADFLLVQITQDKAAEHSKKRFDREAAASDEVRAQLSPRGHDNNVHSKIFKRGNFLSLGWPTKNIFASSDWKRVALTDYDRMPPDIGGEGSGFILAGKRTQTFMSSGMVLAESSPGFLVTDPSYKVSSAHEAPPTGGILSLYNQGDRRLFNWQCPDCGEWYEPDFDLLRYDTNETDPYQASKTVEIVCPHCDEAHYEDDRMGKDRFKLAQNKSGLWVPQGCYLDQNREMQGEARESRIASFWQKGPTAAFQSWNQLVYKYLSALQEYEKTGNLEDLQATVNTDQGKPFTPPRDQERTANDLMERRDERLGKRLVPAWVRFLTASVDVQGGTKTSRFDVMVLGWGRDLESVIIDRFKIEKSMRIHPDDATKFVRISPGQYLEDWDRITELVIKRNYRLDDDTDRFMPITKTSCDSGGEDGVTDQAYEYYRKLKKQGLARRFILIKGGSRISADKITKSYPDNSKRSDRKAKAHGDVPIFLLNTDRIKDTVSHSINRVEPGRRFVHFPKWLPEWVFDEISDETRNATTGKWTKSSSRSRNETFDLFVYNWAIIYEKKADLIDWDNPPAYALPIEENSEILQGDAELSDKPIKRRRRV
jgi:phage terminase large subunit GpA-like protein